LAAKYEVEGAQEKWLPMETKFKDQIALMIQNHKDKNYPEANKGAIEIITKYGKKNSSEAIKYYKYHLKDKKISVHQRLL
jgi:hypothetical protein